MHLGLIAKICGLLLMVFSFTMVPPMVVSWYSGEGEEVPFLFSLTALLVGGLILWLPFMRHGAELQTRDGFLLVTLFWVVLSCGGALPFMLSPATNLDFTDAVFEATSGLTTTGASVLSGIEELPDAMRYYRQQLHFLGGMGIIILAIAILPMLGVGGMQLYKAEIPGPMKEAKLTPRIAETAKNLWYIYIFFTISCAVLYRMAGMDWLEAIGGSFTTVSTGGLAMHDESFAVYDSLAIEMIAIFFMILGSVSFALHFAAMRSRSVFAYLRDPECRLFLGLLVLYTVIVFGGLYAWGAWQENGIGMRELLFQTVSYATGAGLTTTDVTPWPAFVPYFLILISFVGGCAGSTAAGMKVVRPGLVFLQSLRELRRLIHPNGVFALRFGDRPVDERILHAVWGFVGVYIFIAVIMALLFMGTGMDSTTALSATAASLNNLGVGIAGVADGYADISTTAKWAMCLGMLLGRLEIFTILVLLSPMFWRQ